MDLKGAKFPSSSVRTSDGVCRVLPLRFSVCCGSQEVDSLKNIFEDSRKHCWATRKSSEWLRIRLDNKCLVSSLVIDNKHTSEVEVSVALSDTDREFLVVQKRRFLPHDKESVISLGHLPCKYIKVQCFSGTPISFYSIVPMGIQAGFIRGEFGVKVEELIYRCPQHLLFGPSLQASQPPVYRFFKKRTPQIAEGSSSSSQEGRGGGEVEVDYDLENSPPHVPRSTLFTGLEISS